MINCRINTSSFTLYGGRFLLGQDRRSFNGTTRVIRLVARGIRDFFLMLVNNRRLLCVLSMFLLRFVSCIIDAFQVLLMGVIKGFRRYVYNTQRNEGSGRIKDPVLYGRLAGIFRSLYKACKYSARLRCFRFGCGIL